MIFNIICDIIYDMFNSLSTFHACLSSQMQAEPVAAAAHDSEEDRSMDPDDARDYADQFPYPDDPDSPGSINDENLEILAAILNQIPECIDKANFTVFPTFFHMEPVQVATRTVQEAIAVTY